MSRLAKVCRPAKGVCRPASRLAPAKKGLFIFQALSRSWEILYIFSHTTTDKRSFNEMLKILNTEKILAGAPSPKEVRGERGGQHFSDFFTFNFPLKDFLIHQTVKEGFLI